MADLLSEDLLSLYAAARLFPGGRGNARLNSSTVYRWCLNGAPAADGRRVRLEHVRLGGRVLTSRQALSQFAAALTAAAPPDPPTRSLAAREQEAIRAGAGLSADGW